MNKYEPPNNDLRWTERYSAMQMQPFQEQSCLEMSYYNLLRWTDPINQIEC